MLYSVSTLCFETDAWDGFREPGFSKERRLDPQITIGLLIAGFPLIVHAFEGNMAATKTMLPAIEAFMPEHCLSDVTTVARRGIISEANGRTSRRPGCPSSWASRFVPALRGEAIQRQNPARISRRAHLHPAAAGREEPLRGIDEQVAKARESRRRRGSGRAELIQPARRHDQDRNRGRPPRHHRRRPLSDELREALDRIYRRIRRTSLA